MRFFLILTVYLLITNFLVAQDTIVSKYDSTFIVPSKFHGSLLGSYYLINKKDINFDNYYSTSDLIFRRTNFYKFDLGFPGHNTYYSAFAGSPKDNTIMFNGTKITQIEYDYSEINLISPEHFENIEIIEGLDAVLYSGKSASINFQERRYNTAKPYTKIWYSQAGYELIASDGQFSQNLSPKLNFMLGFNNLGADGRYNNQQIELWNIRSTLRYNFDSSTSFSLNYIFNNRKYGLNGGYVPNSPNPENEFETDVFFNNFRERVYRTDIISTFSLKNNKEYLLLNAYFSHTENQLRFENEQIILIKDSTGKNIYNTSNFGLNAFYKLHFFDFLYVNVGGNIEKRKVQQNSFTHSINKANWNMFSKLTLEIINNIFISFGTRYENIYDKNLFSYGSKFELNCPNATYSLDFSTYKILPNLAQGIDKSIETNYLIILNGFWHEFNLKTQIFYHRRNNPIISKLSLNRNYIIYSDNCNCFSTNAFGLSLFFYKRFFDKFNFDFKFVSQYTETNRNNDWHFPLFYSNISGFYEYIVFKSIMRIGIESELFSPIKALYFYPITKDFTLTDEKSKWMGNGLNIFASLRLGNAFLRLSLENVLGRYYYRVKYYPMLDRVFHLSFSWAFND